MPESTIRNVLQRFFEEFQLDLTEERVLNYIVRELHLGRRLAAVIQDPYVKNRVGEQKLANILENKQVIDAVEQELSQAFAARDFKFSE